MINYFFKQHQKTLRSLMVFNRVINLRLTLSQAISYSYSIVYSFLHAFKLAKIRAEKSQNVYNSDLSMQFLKIWTCVA